MQTTCPHCSAPNTTGNSFCTSCGKALPAAARSGPRVVDSKELASSAAGRSLQADELVKQMRSAFRILLWIGVVQAVLGAGISVLATSGAMGTTPSGRASAQALLGIGITVGVIGVIFLGLAAWARRNPLPATITGLVLYITVWAADVIVTVGSDHPEAVTRGIVIKAIIIAYLGKAVSAGIKYRALKRQELAAAPFA